MYSNKRARRVNAHTGGCVSCSIDWQLCLHCNMLWSSNKRLFCRTFSLILSLFFLVFAHKFPSHLTCRQGLRSISLNFASLCRILTFVLNTPTASVAMVREATTTMTPPQGRWSTWPTTPLPRDCTELTGLTPARPMRWAETSMLKSGAHAWPLEINHCWS